MQLVNLHASNTRLEHNTRPPWPHKTASKLGANPPFEQVEGQRLCGSSGSHAVKSRAGAELDGVQEGQLAYQRARKRSGTHPFELALVEGCEREKSRVSGHQTRRENQEKKTYCG
jgi:hypothetical protein